MASYYGPLTLDVGDIVVYKIVRNPCSAGSYVPVRGDRTVSEINNCTVFKTRAMEKNKAGERDRASCNGIRMTYLKREAWKFSRGRCYLSKDPKEVMEPVSGSDQRNGLI